MIFKTISHFLLNKTHLVTVSSNITSSENLAENTAVFSRKKINFLEFLYIQLSITPLEHFPILASLFIKRQIVKKETLDKAS